MWENEGRNCCFLIQLCPWKKVEVIQTGTNLYSFKMSIKIHHTKFQNMFKSCIMSKCKQPLILFNNISQTGFSTVNIDEWCFVLFVGCLTSQQHASVSQGRICTDNFMCCHTEIEAADQTFHLTQSQYTDTGPTSSSADPITPGAWQGSHWSANVEVTGMTRPRKNPGASGIRTRDLPL